MTLKTHFNRYSISALLMGMSENYKANGKRVRLWVEAKTAIHVTVYGKDGKVILQDSFRYVATARNRYDNLCETIR